MNLQRRIDAFAALGKAMRSKVEKEDEAYRSVCSHAYLENNWFTKANIDRAVMEWAGLLTENRISEWISRYKDRLDNTRPHKVGVINAGNIPLVGFHDFISVLISGHLYTGKNSSEDKLLLPYFASLLKDTEPGFGEKIEFVHRLSGYEAVIATGSNNSARYFESYFGKQPHIIRKNRNGVGVLNGKESGEDLQRLGIDIFQYYGLGCRNVSKLYVPENYDFKGFFEAMFSFSEVMQHNKYMNNFDYNNAMLLMKLIPFLQNGFLIIREEEHIASAIAVVHYEKYSDGNLLAQKLDSLETQIQCVVTHENLDLKSELKSRVVKFGEAQSPALNDYADGVDTVQFLSSL